ncbi:MAG: TylF/MycF/NovP-related O-methyltransferase [Pyrinomonadaceae bacterium]
MLTSARLRALHNAVRRVVKEGVPGGIVECGTAAGGSAAMMALTLKELGDGRDVWLFDTFEGLPAPTEHDPDEAHQFTGEFRADLARVRNTFAGFGLSAHFVKGFFRDTLPSSETGRIAVLHVDGDWYESVKDCLVHLYDRVSPGGIIQFDDYGHWEGARKAVDEFMRNHRISSPLRYVDYSARQLVKP